jgi:hypothetical protein
VRASRSSEQPVPGRCSTGVGYVVRAMSSGSSSPCSSIGSSTSRRSTRWHARSGGTRRSTH